MSRYGLHEHYYQPDLDMPKNKTKGNSSKDEKIYDDDYEDEAFDHRRKKMQPDYYEQYKPQQNYDDPKKR